MKREEARREIIRYWRAWRAENLPDDKDTTSMDALAFYDYLRSNRSDLLDFKFSGDKYQQIQSWLRERGLVSD